MFRAIILPIFRSTRLCVTACGIMHPRCCRPVAGNIICCKKCDWRENNNTALSLWQLVLLFLKNQHLITILKSILTFHFSTWHHHDTYVFGHMTLGGWAYSLKLPISHHLVPVEDRHSERADVAQRFSTFSQKKNIFYYQSRRSQQKTQIPTVSHPNITDNYDPINITTFFNKILRLPSATPSSRYCQTA